MKKEAEFKEIYIKIASLDGESIWGYTKAEKLEGMILG